MLADLAQRLVDAIPEAVIVADREGIIQIWNGGAESIFGYSAAEAIGQTLDLIVPERFRDRHWDGYRRVMATGETRYGSELLAVPAVRRDGARISIEFSVALLHDDSGGLYGIGAVMRDVTERWQLERALSQELEQLRTQVAEQSSA
jgi:PAS domain S-box-containing protein